MRFAASPITRSARTGARPARGLPNRPDASAQSREASGESPARPRLVVLAALAIAVLWLHTAWAGAFTMVCPALRGDKLNRQHACEAEDRSPPLQFSGIPAKAKSLAVLMVEQGSAKGNATLWLAYNLAPDTAVLAENQPHARTLKNEGMQIKNVDGKFGYKGPCPPAGATRRFVIEAFVLDTRLDLPENADRRDFLLAAEGHILARAKVNGRYKK